MMRRIYIHNFRCLENFELNLACMNSALLVGQNGTGKTAISFTPEVLQKIGRGINRVGQMVQPADAAGHPLWPGF
ncbi:MAG: AAA family ATPase [Candidatus Xenobiia bacterium LiM19]